MKYQFNLTFTPEDANKAHKIFKSEEAKKDRSELKIRKEKKKIIFKIKAKDTVALKATINSILKMLIVYDKVQLLK